MEYLWLVPVSFLACFVLFLGAALRVQWLQNLGAAAIVCIVLFFAVVAANARDDGRFAGSPHKEWFDQLRSGRGPCCSDADGFAVSDPDWETKGAHYRVRLEGQWIEVPDDAVITEPNRVGRTMVWPIRNPGGISIRCFMPGSMT